MVVADWNYVPLRSGARVSITYTVAAPRGFLGFLETSQDSGSTDQIVNTDGPLSAVVTVNKTP